MDTKLQVTNVPKFKGVFKIIDKRVIGEAAEGYRKLNSEVRQIASDENADRYLGDCLYIVSKSARDESISKRLGNLGIAFLYKNIDPKAENRKAGLTLEKLKSYFA